jgi:anaerobic magnesium-protoporphyrin IX monomethyl ester cyclase
VVHHALSKKEIPDMKVLLINPPYGAEERYGRDLGKFGPLNEPLGLAYLAANLERGGHEVSILDAPAMGLTAADLPRAIGRRGYQVIGVTMLTPMYARSVEVVKAVRKAFPTVTIVVGGAHPTILPRETLLENREIDFAVIGEGEVILLELVEALEKGDSVEPVAGLVYRSRGDVHINPPPEFVSNLDDLPMPARHLLPMDAYHMTRSRTQSTHAFTVSVARGCPFNCAFCCRIFGRKVRHHSVDRIIGEIGILVDRYGAREINMEADTLTLNKSFVFSLCDGLMDSGLSKKIIWTCESRVDTVTEEMLKKMKEAGCWQISYGVETGSQRLLDLIHKDITLERIETTFALTKGIGISIRGFYMLGLPTETREESLRTISFAKKLDAAWSQFTLFTPFPGAELYGLAIQEGGLKSRNWADYKTHGGWTEGCLAYVPKGRSAEEMKSLQKRAYRAVYLRPKVFLRFLRRMNSLDQMRVFATGFWVLLKTLLPKSRTQDKVTRVRKQDLERWAAGVYVDSPVYFAPNPVVRFINWRKLDAALPLLLAKDGQRVLDFGCGNGVMLPTLSRTFKHVVGMDVHTQAAARMVRELQLSNVSLTKADGVRLPFRDSSFQAWRLSC